MLEIAEEKIIFYLKHMKRVKNIHICEVSRNSSYIVSVVQIIMLPIYTKKNVVSSRLVSSFSGGKESPKGVYKTLIFLT